MKIRGKKIDIIHKYLSCLEPTMNQQSKSAVTMKHSYELYNAVSFEAVLYYKES